MRVGVVGLHNGHIGGMFESAAAAADAELVGIVEPDDRLYAQYTESRPITRYSTTSELLSEAHPELVLEGLRHGAKVDLIEACAAAGVHVLLDKPLCRTISDWERIRSAVSGGEIQLSVWYTSRSSPPFLALRRAILDGELGELISFISTHPHKLSAPGRDFWYFDPKAYTGTFHDVACHGIDQIRWLAGAEFTGVHALQTCRKWTDPPFPDHVQASLQLGNGALATVTADWLTPEACTSFGDTRFIIMGTAGSAHLRAYAGNELLISSDKTGVYEPELPADRNGLFVQELIGALSRGERPFIPTADVLAVAQACLIAQESARNGGQFLAIDPLDL